MKIIFLTLFTIILMSQALSQQSNQRSFTYYSKYDKRLVSHETTQKHIFSVGTGLSGFSSEIFPPVIELTNTVPEVRQLPLLKLGIGYHYFFLKSRKLNFYKKERFEHSGFSVYINTYWTQIEEGTYTSTLEKKDTIQVEDDLIVRPENELRITYSSPFLSFRGKMLNFYLLHEYGLSFFNSSVSPYKNAGTNGVNNLFVNIVPLSIKFGTKPIYFKTSLNFAFDNRLLQLQKMKINGGIDIQIYFYKTVKK